MKKRKLETVTLLGIDCVGIERLKLAMEICQKDFEFAQVKILSSLPGTVLDKIIKIEPLNSLEEYSRFVISELDKYIDTSHVLMVQHDGFILNPEAWVDEYLQYDYIGAPWLIADWKEEDFDFPIQSLGKSLVGNGGFSLRSRKLVSLVAKLFKENKISKYNPEDVAICAHYRQLLEDKGIKFAPVDLAKQFSFEAENSDNFAWDGQFGFHGLKWTDISKWSAKHPEYKIENPAANELERLKYL
jgi:hypothetical protein